MMYRSFVLAGLALAVELSAALPAAAAPLSSQDAAFVKLAGQSGMAEVKLARLALSKSKSGPVTSFATHMQADHGQANAQLAAIAKQQGFRLPASVGPKNAALMTKLDAASGSTFDRRYLASQLPAHREVLAAFKREAADGSDPALVNFAKQTIPVIEKHIGMDRSDMAGMGGGAMSMRPAASGAQ